MKALYAGSFDPVTNGHIDIIRQAIEVFDQVIIGVAINPDKQYTFPKDQRIYMIREALAEKKIEVPRRVDVYQYSGLTVAFAKEVKATALVRGLRAVSDFDSEFQMTQFNRQLPPCVQHCFLYAR